MMDLLTKRMQSFAQQEWLHKSVRTLLVVAPGLSVFVATGDQRGVMFAFAALCLSVPYGDRNFRSIHLAGCALASALLMPANVWLQYYPKLYVPFIALAGVTYNTHASVDASAATGTHVGSNLSPLPEQRASR